MSVIINRLDKLFKDLFEKEFHPKSVGDEHEIFTLDNFEFDFMTGYGADKVNLFKANNRHCNKKVTFYFYYHIGETEESIVIGTTTLQFISKHDLRSLTNNEIVTSSFVSDKVLTNSLKEVMSIFKDNLLTYMNYSK